MVGVFYGLFCLFRVPGRPKYADYASSIYTSRKISPMTSKVGNANLALDSNLRWNDRGYVIKRQTIKKTDL